MNPAAFGGVWSVACENKQFMDGITALRAAQTQESKGTAGIQGQVIDSKGKAIAGAMVTAYSSSADGAAKVMERVGAISDKTGQFAIAGLKGSPYVVCTVIPQSAYLDPCRWSEPPVVRIEAGQTSKSVTVQLVRGVQLEVRLEDPGMTVAPFKKGVCPSVLPLVQLKSGRSFPLYCVSSDVDAHDYELAVPAETDFYLSFVGNGVRVADEKGAAIERSKPVAVKSDKAGRVQQLRFRRLS